MALGTMLFLPLLAVLFQVVHGGDLLACIQDSAAVRDLRHGPQATAQSRDGCIKACKEGGFRYAGVSSDLYCTCDNGYRTPEWIYPLLSFADCEDSAMLADPSLPRTLIFLADNSEADSATVVAEAQLATYTTGIADLQSQAIGLSATAVSVESLSLTHHDSSLEFAITATRVLIADTNTRAAAVMHEAESSIVALEAIHNTLGPDQTELANKAAVLLHAYSEVYNNAEVANAELDAAAAVFEQSVKNAVGSYWTDKPHVDFDYAHANVQTVKGEAQVSLEKVHAAKVKFDSAESRYDPIHAAQDARTEFASASTKAMVLTNGLEIELDVYAAFRAEFSRYEVLLDVAGLKSEFQSTFDVTKAALDSQEEMFESDTTDVSLLLADIERARIIVQQMEADSAAEAMKIANEKYETADPTEKPQEEAKMEVEALAYSLIAKAQEIRAYTDGPLTALSDNVELNMGEPEPSVIIGVFAERERVIDTVSQMITDAYLLQGDMIAALNGFSASNPEADRLKTVEDRVMYANSTYSDHVSGYEAKIQSLYDDSMKEFTDTTTNSRVASLNSIKGTVELIRDECVEKLELVEAIVTQDIEPRAGAPETEWTLDDLEQMRHSAQFVAEDAYACMERRHEAYITLHTAINIQQLLDGAITNAEGNQDTANEDTINEDTIKELRDTADALTGIVVEIHAWVLEIDQAYGKLSGHLSYTTAEHQRMEKWHLTYNTDVSASDQAPHTDQELLDLAETSKQGAAEALAAAQNNKATIAVHLSTLSDAVTQQLGVQDPTLDAIIQFSTACSLSASEVTRAVGELYANQDAYYKWQAHEVDYLHRLMDQTQSQVLRDEQQQKIEDSINELQDMHDTVEAAINDQNTAMQYAYEGEEYTQQHLHSDTQEYTISLEGVFQSMDTLSPVTTAALDEIQQELDTLVVSFNTYSNTVKSSLSSETLALTSHTETESFFNQDAQNAQQRIDALRAEAASAPTFSQDEIAAKQADLAARMSAVEQAGTVSEQKLSELSDLVEAANAFYRALVNPTLTSLQATMLSLQHMETEINSLTLEIQDQGVLVDDALGKDFDELTIYLDEAGVSVGGSEGGALISASDDAIAFRTEAENRMGFMGMSLADFLSSFGLTITSCNDDYKGKQDEEGCPTIEASTASVAVLQDGTIYACHAGICIMKGSSMRRLRGLHSLHGILNGDVIGRDADGNVVRSSDGGATFAVIDAASLDNVCFDVTLAETDDTTAVYTTPTTTTTTTATGTTVTDDTGRVTMTINFNDGCI